MSRSFSRLQPTSAYARVPAAFAAVALFSVVFAPPPLHAQEGLSTPVVLPDITISSTTVPQATEDVGSSVTVITDTQLQAQQRRTVPDALQAAPGLNVVPTGGPGGQTSVFVRGTNSNHVKVLIDGIDVRDPSNPNGSFDFGQLLTADLDSIEILRGPQSGLYGSDSIGGVISVFTKRGEGPPKLTFRGEGGSFGTDNESLRLSGGTATYDYTFNVAHFAARNVPVTPPDLVPGGRTIGNNYDNVTLSTKLGVHFTDSIYADATARYIDSTLLFTGDDFSVFPSVPASVQSRQHNGQLFTRGAVHFDPVGTTIKNRVAVGYTQSDTRSFDPLNGAAPNFGTRVKADYQGQVDILPDETLIAGAETQVDRLRVPTTNARIGNGAGYLQLLSNLGNRFFMASNIRYDANDTFGGYATYRLAPSFHLPVTETVIKGSYGTAFRAPTLSQLYVDFPSFGFFANRNLRPETSRGYDIGFEQPLPGTGMRFGADYYDNDIRNLIDYNATFTSNINVGRARTYGAEAFASYALTDALSLRADYTYTMARNEITDLELLRRPRNKGSLQVILKPVERLTLSATVIAIGRFIDGNRDFSIPRLTNGGHTTVNLAGSYDLSDHTQVFARVDNLFDLRYQDPTGFLQPGLAAYGGARLVY